MEPGPAVGSKTVEPHAQPRASIAENDWDLMLNSWVQLYPHHAKP